MYKLSQNTNIIRLSDNAIIPVDHANRAYREYLEWRAKGNVPLPSDAPLVIIPQEVSMHQARLALLANGLLDVVEAEMRNQSRAANISWEYAANIHRNSPLVLGIANILGFTPTQLDELFTLASTID